MSPIPKDVPHVLCNMKGPTAPVIKRNSSIIHNDQQQEFLGQDSAFLSTAILFRLVYCSPSMTENTSFITRRYAMGSNLLVKSSKCRSLVKTYRKALVHCSLRNFYKE